MRGLIICVMLFVSSIASAHEGHFTQLPDWETIYPADRIFAVGVGETKAMPTGEYDLIWIEGTLVAPRAGDLNLTTSEIVVAPGGHLDMGTPSDPVTGSVTITFVDGGFVDGDAAQWGHGLLVFGRFDCWGVERTPWIEDAATGTGWLTSDRLMYPDTRPVGPSYLQQYRKGLTAPAPGNSVVGSLAANMTRSITFRSASPAGTRGHTMYMDHAQVSIGYAAFDGLGRTKPEPLSPTNLIGRYPIHFHHLYGTPGTASNGLVKGVVVDGLDYRSKWGIVIHHTSWVDVLDCVVTRVGGAGFVTEDGHEVGNKFIGNLAFDCSAGVRQFPVDVHEGFQGSGFWCKSMVQVFENNVAMNCRHGFQSAINRENTPAPKPDAIPKLSFQRVPGGPLDGEITQYQTTLSGKNNRFVCNSETGYDAWGSSCDIGDQPPPVYVSMKALPVHWEDCEFAFNGIAQAQHAFTQSCTAFTDCSFIGGYSSGFGNKSLVSYNRVMYFDGCLFSGTQVGAMTGRGSVFADCVFDVPTGIQLDGESAQQWPYGVTFENNTYSGTPFVLTKTAMTIEDISTHSATLDDVYADIAAFREAIIGEPDTDPNEAERQRLIAEIASVNAQIANLQTLLADLQRQLEALGN